ncbi:MAG: glycosyltransferase family 4 protein [Chroococcidiopsidaceae cyanobacterium CP_BM_ER_R8_30]|nr:glycosyltransferase family 4 protein [Chroococcidiopsidaceae cyanobacterium CP_BM_ER_R8_30]
MNFSISLNSKANPRALANGLNIVMVGACLNQNGGIATVEKLILKHVPSDIEIQHISSHDEGSILYRLIVFERALVTLLWRLLSRKTDLIHIHLSDGGSILRKAILTIVAFMFRKPVVMHAHGAEFHSTYFGLPKIAQQVLGGILRQCDGFIVLSKTWEDFYISNLGLNAKQVFVLPNPTELPAQVIHRTNVTKVSLVFCGRIGQRKGAFDLIRAFANLPVKQKNDSQLILAGDGELKQGRKLVESLNLTEHVTFLGWIDASARDELLSKADVFVLPSYNEGLPMALLEAMGWGLPTIATPVGGIPDLVTSNKNGLLVTPGDIQQLSAAMQLLIENETLRLSLGSAARETVAPFDVKTYCYRLSDVYGSVLESNEK